MKTYLKKIISPIIFYKTSQTKTANGFERIYHNHLRKCAGTSINKALILSLGGNDNTYQKLANTKLHKINLKHGPVVGWNNYAINRQSFFYAFSHEPLHRLTFDNSTFTFCFLRDPVERLISHYNMLKDLIDEVGTNDVLVSEEKFAFGDFDHFLDNIPREHLEAQLFNFSSDYNVEEAIYSLRSHINCVSDFKEPNKDLLPFLSSEFGLNIDYRHLRSSKTKFKPSSDQYERAKNMVSDEANFITKAMKYCGLNLNTHRN